MRKKNNVLVDLDYKDNGIAVMTMNNPPANALSTKGFLEIQAAIEEVIKNKKIHVVIITGAGEKFFVAGFDIKEFPEYMKQEEGARSLADLGHETWNMLAALELPTIAAINGIALGGGCELAISCDIRIMSENAIIGLPEIKLGLFPGGGGTQRLPRLVGRAKAKELMFFGESINAYEALRIGLVNQIYPETEVYIKAIALANRIVELPGVALSYIKKAVDYGMEKPLKNGLQKEGELFVDIFKTQDMKEGVSAFIDKRKPSFKNC